MTDTAGAVCPHHMWWQSLLRGAPVEVQSTETITAIDLFCGIGGLSLGATFAAGAIGASLSVLASVDLDEDALGVYRANFKPDLSLQTSVTRLIDYHVYGRGETATFAYTPEVLDQRLSGLRGEIDLVLAGPPCQGHSNLNNHSRRDDPRNQLYLSAVALSIALAAKVIVIENVPEVVADKTKVVATAQMILKEAGYHVTQAMLTASDFGGAQLRKRHFTIASLNPHASFEEISKSLKREPMTLREITEDLIDIDSRSFMDEVSVLSAENQDRISYLFEHDLYDLPNEVRPKSHREGHTYPSVYGRLHWDKPSPTITTGFMSPGRGRYIHPSCQRVITAHEAARIQGFPDSFSFTSQGSIPSRKSLSKWIGDAVPTQLGYVTTLAALSGL